MFCLKHCPFCHLCPWKHNLQSDLYYVLDPQHPLADPWKAFARLWLCKLMVSVKVVTSLASFHHMFFKSSFIYLTEHASQQQGRAAVFLLCIYTDSRALPKDSRVQQLDPIKPNCFSYVYEDCGLLHFHFYAYANS